MWLLIDDMRDMKVDVIARTPEAGIKLLFLGGWSCLCLDHDLAAEMTGFDVLRIAITNDLVPDKVILVTSNPVGRDNMKALLLDVGYTNNVGYTFFRQ